MNVRKLKVVRRMRRKGRVRQNVFGTAERPRLTVFRSHKHIYAQLIDDVAGTTLCAAGSKSKSLANELKNGGNVASAAVVGRLLAERARMKGIRKAAFDRNGYRYHGRVKSLADSARKSGLEF